MLYQLPDGRVIVMSVSDYLSISDEELRNIEASGYGDYISNPTYGSAITGSQKDIKDDESSYHNDMDYNPTEDE